MLITVVEAKKFMTTKAKIEISLKAAKFLLKVVKKYEASSGREILKAAEAQTELEFYIMGFKQ